MQKSRREFVKKAAIVGAGAAAVGTTTVLANSTTSVPQTSGNGVVKGKSAKKEILYTKTAAWEEFYKSAK